MKLTDLSSDLKIALSNEEAAVLEQVLHARPLAEFTDREKVIISTLVRKSCLSKVVHEKTVMVVKNGI
jgi:hypothetical protein